ncbi:LOW QUALITY PROTEIN: SET domain-containing protein SmydA-8 [Drosophila gunungcola]|uniref:LOW QUALITY PROTEIN: SET domain-containing protein SmydA-8 n=1 Tax=Drosophila gunungcola TaxID=103775 RepID=UPI0022E02DE8|nr:LOW QUALITY PROTEIN: SET domain-containing protein SmydA-8 [Drosophila gunungcola]
MPKVAKGNGNRKQNMAAVTDDFVKKCEVKQNEALGRFVVAQCNLRAGETVLLEQPIVVLPHMGDRRCSKCFKLTQSFCRKCLLLVLCEDCPDHDNQNCQRLAEIKLSEEQVKLVQEHSDIQPVLKCLLLKEHPETLPLYEEMTQMETHLAARKGTDIWKHYQEHAFAPLEASGVLRHLQTEADEDLVQGLLSILDVNAYEIRAPEAGGSMKGLYRRAALFAHSCIPNLVTAIDEERRIKVYANRFIAAGEILYICYTNVLLGTEERREILKVGKYFHCSCPRCQDPTELGTHMSSFICSHCSCPDGFIIRMPETGTWQCVLNPDHTLKQEFVSNMLERAKEEIFHAKDDIYRLELLLAKLSRLLHRNHYLMLDLKQNIASILRQILQNITHRPNRKVYERKIRLCQEILLVLKVVAPGISRLKAIALYELANTQAELARKQYSEQELSASDLQATLEQVEVMIRESLRMLLFEPLATPEGQLSRSLLRELKELQDDIKNIQESNDD